MTEANLLLNITEIKERILSHTAEQLLFICHFKPQRLSPNFVFLPGFFSLSFTPKVTLLQPSWLCPYPSISLHLSKPIQLAIYSRKASIVSLNSLSSTTAPKSSCFSFFRLIQVDTRDSNHGCHKEKEPEVQKAEGKAGKCSPTTRTLLLQLLLPVAAGPRANQYSRKRHL